MKDLKYRGNWYVVQKITPRDIYDIPIWLEMDEILDLNEEKAFQQEEQILVEFLIDEELVTAPLNRANLLSNEVEADFVFNLDDLESND